MRRRAPDEQVEPFRIKFHVPEAKDESRSQGVELLAHIKEALSDADKIWRDTLIERLIARDESPWANMRGPDGLPRDLIEQVGAARRLVTPY